MKCSLRGIAKFLYNTQWHIRNIQYYILYLGRNSKLKKENENSSTEFKIQKRKSFQESQKRKRYIGKWDERGGNFFKSRKESAGQRCILCVTNPAHRYIISCHYPPDQAFYILPHISFPIFCKHFLKREIVIVIAVHAVVVMQCFFKIKVLPCKHRKLFFITLRNIGGFECNNILAFTQ